MTDLVNQLIQGSHDAVAFVDYVEDFYGKDGLYDLGATRDDIKEACLIYLVALATNGENAKYTVGTWGDGDTVDREKVRLVLEKVLNCREEGK